MHILCLTYDFRNLSCCMICHGSCPPMALEPLGQWPANGDEVERGTVALQGEVTLWAWSGGGVGSTNTSFSQEHRQASLFMTELELQWWKPTICWLIYSCNNCSSPYEMGELECVWETLRVPKMHSFCFKLSSVSWPCQQQKEWRKYFPALDSSCLQVCKMSRHLSTNKLASC